MCASWLYRYPRFPNVRAVLYVTDTRPGTLLLANFAGNHCWRRTYRFSTDGKNTISSSEPPSSRGIKGDIEEDQGHLAFTKTSLYKLTLPLHAPSFKLRKRNDPMEDRLPRDVEVDDDPTTGVQESTSAHQTFARTGTPTSNVVFLLHSGQPLSYITDLIRAEDPDNEPSSSLQHSHSKSTSSTSSSKPDRPHPNGPPSISFHTRKDDKQRWSPATGIGDFLRDAALAGSFVIRMGNRTIEVNVPSFEDRTRFLRADLAKKTREIEALAKIKVECDLLAHSATQKVAIAGAGVLGVWWITVSVLTFNTSLGWDTMEPITYLTSLGTVISGYLWFLWHNREVSYRTVLTETTSQRQQKLYAQRGFHIEKYHELIDEVKELRKAVKRVAWDYDITWDQGDTGTGKASKRALNIVRREEDREIQGSQQSKKTAEEDDQEDMDANGVPDDEEKYSRVGHKS